MTKRYDHAQVQEYWQYVWDRDDVYALPEGAEDPTYVLGMFPYTSGTLHMGHVRNYAITDAYARFRRMCGDDVFHPMGWDAFGLPAENAANERRSDPETWTRECIERMREQMETLGFGYDWSAEVTTCDPSYYRWNQWLFERFYEAGLVSYEAATVNWCPDCETVLADAQVEEQDGASVCWRCETPVEGRELDQWFFTITDYVEELHDGLDDLDGWPESVRNIQRNWIGRQEGVRLPFEVSDHGAVEVFTTRLDTIYGATFLALSPEHDLATAVAEENEAVAEYVERARGAKWGTVQDGDSSSVDDGHSGVETGLTAIHPLTGEELPVYVAGYVLPDVGTGAVMGVPAHNERDHVFARDHALPIEQVVEPADGGDTDLPDAPFTDEGVLTNSGDLDGVTSGEATERLLTDLDEAEPTVTYRLRDWLISRQRYWGTPIPVVHCDDCGHVLVPEAELPVELPEFVQTTGNPLAEIDSFVETDCPDCGGPARRETDTMDTFVDSSWYFLRFLSPDLEDAPFDTDRANEWLPIDVYVGGEEHAILHLLYIRFFTRALADLGLLDVREPVDRLVNHGMVRYEGEKMSKTRGNVVAPHEYGPETTRLFVLSAAHPERDFEWTAKDVGAAYDLQQTLYGMVRSFVEQPVVREERAIHDEFVMGEIDRTVAAVTADYERFRFHRVVSEVRALARLLRRYRDYEAPHGDVYRCGLETLALLIAPVTPYLGEELWNMLQAGGLAVTAEWPTANRDSTAARLEREIVERTLEDVRDIVEVADIEEPEEIELVVAQNWKYRAYELAREADPDTSLVEHVMADDAIARQREAGAEFAAWLQERRESLEPIVEGDREQRLLEEAAWLFRDEFGVYVTVRRAIDGPRGREEDPLGARARPNRPAIHIS